jgi:hypothetical protein
MAKIFFKWLIIAWTLFSIFWFLSTVFSPEFADASATRFHLTLLLNFFTWGVIAIPSAIIWRLLGGKDNKKKKLCPSCGKYFETEGSFCPFCGSKESG